MNAGSAQWTHSRHYRSQKRICEISRNAKQWKQCVSSTWLIVCAFLGAVSGCSSPRYCSQAPYMFLLIRLNMSKRDIKLRCWQHKEEIDNKCFSEQIKSLIVPEILRLQYLNLQNSLDDQVKCMQTSTVQIAKFGYLQANRQWNQPTLLFMQLNKIEPDCSQ